MARADKFDGFNYRDSGYYSVLLPAGSPTAIAAGGSNDLSSLDAGDTLTLVSGGAAARNRGGVGVNASITAGATGDPSCVIEVAGRNQFDEEVTERMTVTESASTTNPVVAGKTAWTQITSITLISKTGVSGTTSLNVGYGLTVAGAAQLPVIGVPWRNFLAAEQVREVVALDSAFARTLGAASTAAFTDENRNRASFHPTSNAIFDASLPSLAHVRIAMDAIT